MRRFCSVSAVMGNDEKCLLSRVVLPKNSHLRTPGERMCSETWEVRLPIAKPDDDELQRIFLAWLEVEFVISCPVLLTWQFKGLLAR